MPASEQENGGLAALLGAPPAAKPSAAPAQPFRFAPPRALIDWRALHALDVAAIARDTDIDALERVLDVVAFGDIEAEVRSQPSFEGRFKLPLCRGLLTRLHPATPWSPPAPRTRAR